MKAIKVILGIIITLTFVFLGTGLIVKEAKYTAEIVVEKPVKEVFTLFNDKEELKKWMPEIKSIEAINETPQKLGSTYKLSIKNQDIELTMQRKIRAFVPNEKVTFQFNSPDMIKIDDFNFLANGNSTKIIQHSSIRANSFLLACTFPWFTSKFKQLSQDYMSDFKELAEQ